MGSSGVRLKLKSQSNGVKARENREVIPSQVPTDPRCLGPLIVSLASGFGSLYYAACIFV